ncbi:hypothetical protein ACHAXR_008359, partial [Thalassiosira sp. AJA248-18]
MFYHQCLCSPTVSTLIKAIRNQQLKSWPGLTIELIKKHLPPASATARGHMVRTRQGTNSTRNMRQEIIDARTEADSINPPEQVCTAIDNEMFVFAALADTNADTIYTDLTGRFPVRSYSGMQYLFIAYIYTINAILIRPMPSRTDASMIAAFTDVYDYLEARKCKPKLHVLDNECSKAVRNYVTSKDTKIQLVEPHNHRVNAAEPAVKTVKAHFKSALATLDKNCPLQLWDKFLPQVQDTLNMLRTSRRNAKISAYEEMEGAFDYNKTPMAPLGTKALAYIAPDERASWQMHCSDAFYVGRAPNHYRLLQFYDPTTCNYKITGTYELFPSHCNVPSISEGDRTIIAATDLLHEIGAYVPTTAAGKCAHSKILHKLTSVLGIATHGKKGGNRNGTPSRVNAGSPRVQNDATTSIDTTSPRVVRATRQVHQRHTRNNTPVPTTMQVIEPPVQKAPNNKSGTTESTQLHAPPAFPMIRKRGRRARKVHGVTIGSARNSSKQASRKRIQNLVTLQLQHDKQTNLNNELEQRTYKLPQEKSYISFHVPTPKSSKPLPIPITQDEEDEDEGETPIATPNRRSPRRTTNLHNLLASHVIFVGTAILENATKNLQPDSLFHTNIEEFANGVVHPETNETITKYSKLIKEPILRDVWLKAMCIELGRLANGYGDTEGTNTFKFMSHDEISNIPGDRTVTYARIVVDYRPQKKDPNRVRITAGGNLIDYPGELTTRTADLTTSKILWNSTISTPGARYCCADAKNFYLCTPLDRHEYMRMPVELIPPEIIDLYDLTPKIKNGYVYMEIIRGMYGLPQSGMLANKLLKERLEEDGFIELPHTPGLFKHKTRPVWFCLTVDDF